jgi:hypothetical protein
VITTDRFITISGSFNTCTRPNLKPIPDQLIVQYLNIFRQKAFGPILAKLVGCVRSRVFRGLKDAFSAFCFYRFNCRTSSGANCR